MRLLTAAAIGAATFWTAQEFGETFETTDFGASTAIASAVRTAQPPTTARSAAPSVRELLAAARGASPLMCALAAGSVRNSGWNVWSDAPVSPLSRLGITDTRQGSTPDTDHRVNALSSADIAFLLESIGSDDACVQELAVRMLGRQRSEESVAGLVTRLSGPTPALREVAALGLGIVRSKTAIDPLTRALRDNEAGVRANAAWALGRLRGGVALGALQGMMSDADERVRVAVVTAIGQIDSTSSVPALLRVAQRDESPRVRRVAAWALGQLKASEAIDALGSIATGDRDPLVREMAVWALGDMNGRAGAATLARVLQDDSDDRVRETAAWALGEIGDRTAAEALGRAVGNDRSDRVRGTAAWALGQSRVRGMAVPAGLVSLLASDDADLRLKAAWTLGQIGDSSAAGAVKTALARETREDVRRALTRALIKSGGSSRASLEELLQSKDPQTREAAVRGLTGRDAMGPWPWPWPRPRPFP